MLRVLSTLAMQGALPALMARHTTATGVTLSADYAPTVAALERLRGGMAADLAILTAQGVEEMMAEAILRPGSRVDIAVSFVGVAVRAGAPHPDIATPAAFHAALLAARSIAYSRIGASGLFFAGLIERMGIAAEVNAKALITTGFTAALLPTGEAELAIQQVSELMMVPGIEVVGRLPAALQAPATFSGGVLAASADPAAAADFLRVLASPGAAPALRNAGLEPCSGVT
jgi:molybdate transport system substrate-binding protein